MKKRFDSTDAAENLFHIPISRRRLLKSIAAVSAGFTLPGYLAEAATISPVMTQGPFYPAAHNIPLDKDNDLVQLNGNLTIASGLITYFTGRVLDVNGSPVRGALIELWHADREGDYVYSGTTERNAACDPNFAGFGQYLTGADGRYLFRTIKPGLYPGRTRHTHFGVTLPGRTTRTSTQTFWNEVSYDLNGNQWPTQNSNDAVFASISNPEQRASVLLTPTPVAGTTTGEMLATWDFVSGFTPVEPTYPNGGSLLIAAQPITSSTGARRFKITLPAYTGYTYEIYGNPTLANLQWKAFPFSINETAAVDRNKHAATADGTLTFYVNEAADKGFYYVTFRVPGANTGTP